MMKQSRRVHFLLGLSLLIFPAGCSRNPANQSSPAANTTTQNPKSIHLTYWVGTEIKEVAGLESQTQEYGDYAKIQAAEYEKQHPDVSIEVQGLVPEDLTKKVTAAIAAGTPPDLLMDYLGRTSGYAYQDLLEDFHPALPRAELEDYDPDLIRLYTIKGKLHGLPTISFTVHIVANRAIWEKAGKANLLPKEDDGSWTYDQFLTAMRAVAQPNKLWPWWTQFASEQGDYGNWGFFWGKGAYVYKTGDYSRVTLNTPKGVEALTFLVQMAKDGLIEPGSTTINYSELENMIGKGETAAWSDSLYAFQRIKVARAAGKVSVPIKLQMLQFPHEPGRKTPLPLGPSGIVVFKQTDAAKRAAALDFARWLNSPRFQRIYAANMHEFPSRKSTGNPLAGDPNYKLVQRWMAENGRVDLGLAAPSFYKVRVAAVPHMQAAILGQKTPAQALQDFETEANAILKENR
jgi:ABC-type glycerol-3-phosphate transport system substrate-binding protein